MPTFNGEAIFGIGVVMKLVINPVERQQTTYPGLSGVEELTMGQRGAFTEVSGVLVGATLSDLNAARLTFYSYYDGQPYELVDNFGAAWPNVKLDTFQPTDRVCLDDSYGYFMRYTARFFHQTLS